MEVMLGVNRILPTEGTALGLHRFDQKQWGGIPKHKNAQQSSGAMLGGQEDEALCSFSHILTALRLTDFSC